MATEINLSDIQAGTLDKPNTLVVLMCFGATCGPCKFTMPHYEETSKFFQDITQNIEFFSINAWEPQEQRSFLESMLQISGVPTFKLFYNSKEVFSRSGGGDFSVLKEMVENGINEVFNIFGVKI